MSLQTQAGEAKTKQTQVETPFLAILGHFGHISAFSAKSWIFRLSIVHNFFLSAGWVGLSGYFLIPQVEYYPMAPLPDRSPVGSQV